MFADTFIRRPILASVCSLVLILAGAIAIPTMPVAQYPSLAPPVVTVTAIYTGANAQEVETAVTTPLEQAINGVEGMLYMSSSSTNSGVSTISVTFDVTREPGRGAGRRAEPRQPGARPDADRSADDGHHGPEAVHRVRHGRRRVRGEQRVRLAVPQQLRRRLREGRPQACARRQRRHDLRRAQVFDAALARAGSAGRAAAHGGRRRERAARAERAGRGGQPGPGAGAVRSDVPAERARAGPPPRAGGVRQHHPEERRRRLARPVEGRRTVGARRRDLQRGTQVPGSRGGRLRRHPAADGQCARRGTRRRRRARRPLEAVSARGQVPGRVQHDRRRRGVDSRGAEDARRGDRPRRARHLHLPPDLAQHADPRDHDPGVARRHVRLHQADGLLHQHADAVRPDPGDRHRRRRRDRRDREHRTAHPGVQGPGAKGRGRRDGRGARRGDRDGARAHRRLRARRLLPGHDGTALRPVLDDDRVRGRALGLQRRHADTRAVRAAARSTEPPQGALLHVLRARDCGGHDGVREGRCDAGSGGGGPSSCCSPRRLASRGGC